MGKARVIKFNVQKSKFQKFINSQKKFASCYTDGVLSGINVKIKDEALIFTSTDGNRTFATSFPTNGEKDFKDITLQGWLLNRIRFAKGNIDSLADVLEIQISSKGMAILDISNKIKYQIPVLKGKYPDIEKLLKQYKFEEKTTTIAFNARYITEIISNMAVNERTNIVKLTFKNKDPLHPIIVEADNHERQTTSLLMPVQIR